MKPMRYVLMAMAMGMAGAGARPLYACCDPASSVTITSPSSTSKYTFSPDTTGELTVSCSATADPDCRSGSITWDCATPGIYTSAIWAPPSRVGSSATLTLRTLPLTSGGLGGIWVSAAVDSQSALTAFKVFFPRYATNHPNPGSGISPNWFHYWMWTTTAKRGNPGYDPMFSLGYTTWDSDGECWRSYIGSNDDKAYTPAEGRNAGTQLEGIDHFAYACRHEYQHYLKLTEWWPNGYVPADDEDDEDMLPDALESELGGTYENRINGGNFVCGYPDTDADDRLDGEDYTMNTQELWSVGDANDEDWANPGKQY